MAECCKACDDPFVWNDDVIIVDNDIYHKDCVDIFPVGYFAMIDGNPLGETENEDGQMACEVIEELLTDDEED